METILLCTECYDGIVTQEFVGDEGWGICQVCGATEQSTIELTIEEFEAIIETDLDLDEKIKELDRIAQEMLNNLNNL